MLRGRGASRPDMTHIFLAEAYFGLPRTGVPGEVADSPQVMGITDLRAHPGRILIVFGAPIAFAVTGFLHLVADGDAPGCQVWGRTAASRAGRANRGQRRPCQPHTSTRAPDDLSHWHLVVGGRRYRRCSCVEPGGARRTATIPLALAGIIGAVDHAAPFGPVAMLLFIIAAFVLSRTRTARLTSDLTMRT